MSRTPAGSAAQEGCGAVWCHGGVVQCPPTDGAGSLGTLFSHGTISLQSPVTVPGV